jgi:3-oxoacyl-[acyl-carrier protein] reductase
MSDKTILVVGASRGIGKAIVDRLAGMEGYRILAFARNTERMKTNFTQFDNVEIYGLDLSKSDVRESIENFIDHVDQIDFMINNAGALVNKPFTELTNEDISYCYNVNVIGVMHAVQACVPKMKSAHIVNISSIGGFQGSVKFPGLAAYSTSKAALCSFTELFAEEYKDSDIKMNCLCLGAVQTEMLEEAFPGYEAPVSAEKMAEYIVDFTLRSHEWMNGKIIPVSLSTP